MVLKEFKVVSRGFWVVWGGLGWFRWLREFRELMEFMGFGGFVGFRWLGGFGEGVQGGSVV